MGFLTREGLRSGEAVTLRVGVGVGLERGAVSLDKNRTNDPRSWALEQGVLRALKTYVRLRDAQVGAPLFIDRDGAPFDNRKLAQVLRADLETAGITRRELHEKGENTAKLLTHGLRGTFVTLSLANGKTETWLADRTGHRSSTMINGYRRQARSATELGLGLPRPRRSGGTGRRGGLKIRFP